ncbi:MAG: acetyl esterase/lipase [Polaribacter sp.]|jgi:acetyl esterase/lipase
MVDTNFWSKLFCLMLVSVLVSACSSHQRSYNETAEANRNFNTRVVENIVYSPSEWPQQLNADLYLPQTTEVLPVVLMAHGGGWSRRDRSDMQSTAIKLAKKGFAVLNVSYRFAPEFIYPAQIQDLQLALLWLQGNANKYQLDLNRVNAWGYSSGAHLVALLAGTISGEAQTLALTPELPKIRAVVVGGIPADLSVYSGSPIIVPFLGADRDGNPELYQQASPINHISAGDPPVFLYHGKLDTLVEKEQSINYYNALRRNDIPAELYLDSLWGHFAMFLFGWDAENKAVQFLNHHNFQNNKEQALFKNT